MTITLTYYGHATHSFDINGTQVLVDPFFTDNPVATVSADSLNPNYILITHGHGDHVGDTIAIARRTGAQIIGNFEMTNWFMAQGLDNVGQQHIGGGVHYPFGYVKLTPAWHGSVIEADGSYGGMPNGFVIEADGKRIYTAGDTGLFGDMALIGEDGLDLAILPIGDRFTMGPADALKALKLLKPKRVVPEHYNTWPPIEQDAAKWAADVAALGLGIEAVVMNPGDTLTL